MSQNSYYSELLGSLRWSEVTLHFVENWAESVFSSYKCYGMKRIFMIKNMIFLGGKGEGGMSLMCWKRFLFPGWFFIYLLLWRSLTEEDGNLLTEIIYLIIYLI